MRALAGISSAKIIFTQSRVILLAFAWIAALFAIIFGDAVSDITRVGAICLLCFAAIVAPALRWDSLVILAGLAALVWMIHGAMPSFENWLRGTETVLVFAALLPTMALVRATAMTMPSVHDTQERLAGLPSKTSAGGLQIAGHIFGGIINTGAFALLSAALPEDSSEDRRKAAAEAAIRGMVSSAAWSPFFVAFAIGQNFVAPHHAWAAIGVGGITALLFSVISLLWFNRDLTMVGLGLALGCMAPVAWRLVIVLVAVLLVALIFDLTALSAVVTVMPMLVLVQMMRHRHQIRHIIRTTHQSMLHTADDIVVIAAAMLVAFFASQTTVIAEMVALLYADQIPGWAALVLTPLIMMMASVVGIHPAITSTALLTIFSAGGAAVHPALLVQSHLIGWGAGTMCSVASLSVISSASLYRIPARKLALGPNLGVAFCYALGGGGVLSLVNVLILSQG